MSLDASALQTLELEKLDGVARVTLDRPDAANAIDLTMARELYEVALDCDEDPGVRCVVLQSRGKVFCAGGDLASFADAGDAMPRLLKQVTQPLHAAVARFARMDAPVLAAVGGAAAGAGFSLVCAADLVIAAETAKFTMAYTRAGLTPDGSSTWFLPRLIGRHRTLELMLLNPTLSAADALQWGLVNRVVPADELESRVAELATTLAQGATAAFGTSKRLVLASADRGLESQMELESEGIAAAARTEDAREGMSAFFEKRTPEFRGR